jgi:hypothetical protein
MKQKKIKKNKAQSTKHKTHTKQQQHNNNPNRQWCVRVQTAIDLTYNINIETKETIPYYQLNQ